jgi:ABC-type transport system substrate-binding protein
MKYGILFIIAGILFVYGCSSTETTTVRTSPVTFRPDVTDVADPSDITQTSPFSITIGEAEPVRSLDPLYALNAATQRAVALIYEGLTRLDADGIIHPALAKSWEVSADSTTYTFTLERNAFFHNDNAFTSGFGRPVHSEDVAYVFTRMTSRNVPPYASELFRTHIKGFDAYLTQTRNTFFSDELFFEGITGITTPNDSTVVFQLNRPYAGFVNLLAHPFASIYPREAVNRRNFSLHSNPVGTGHFSMSMVSGDSLITLERHFNHYNATLIESNLSSVSIRIFRDESSLFRNLASGRIDIIPHAGPQTVQTVITSDHQLGVSYNELLTAVKRGSDTFYLLYFSDNNAGIPMRELSWIKHALQDVTPDGNIEKTLHFDTIQPPSVDAINERQNIGYTPSIFIAHTARKIISDATNKPDFQLYGLRVPNGDIVLNFTDKHPEQFKKAVPLATFIFPHFSLMHKNTGGITFNHEPWWMGFEAVQRN